MRRAFFLLFSFTLICSFSHAQLLKKIKDKVDKTVNGKSDSPSQDSNGSTASSSSSSTSSSSSSGSSSGVPKEYTAAKYGTKIATLRKGEQFMYDEIGIVSNAGGGDGLTFVTRMGKEYFLYENDKVSGPFSTPPVDKIKGYNTRGNSGNSGEDRGGKSSSQVQQYMKLNSKYQQELLIGGKKYGPFSMVMQLSVSPDQTKFFAVAADPSGAFFLVTPKGKTKLPAMPTDWFISPGFEKCGITLSADQVAGKKDPTIDVNSQMFVVMDDGTKIGPIEEYYSSEKSLTANGQLIQKKNSDSKQLYVNGKPSLKFPIEISNVEGVMLNETATSGAVFNNGSMYFSDGTNIGYMVLKPSFIKQDGKNYVKWMSYDSQTNNLYACKKEL